MKYTDKRPATLHAFEDIFLVTAISPCSRLCAGIFLLQSADACHWLKKKVSIA
jgi:hypothetical protein